VIANTDVDGIPTCKAIIVSIYELVDGKFSRIYVIYLAMLKLIGLLFATMLYCLSFFRRGCYEWSDYIHSKGFEDNRSSARSTSWNFEHNITFG
jgi:hypothetical protein